VNVAGTIRTWGRMVKFSHSVFALPFALSGVALAMAGLPFDRAMGWKLFWVVLAMIGARNAAMGFNRLADHRIDAANPRTARRELPRGALPRSAVWIVTLLLSALFVFASFKLNRLCGRLSPVALLTIFGYSYSKRFTWSSHLWLGLALAMAPVGGWLAVTGEFAQVAWLLGLAVLLWVAGFDVIYACQDIEFDQASGLFSIPARFGVRRALWLARGLHLGAVAAMVAVGWVAGLTNMYFGGLVLIAAILVWEHRLVRADDLSKLGVAFFNMNAVISVIYLILVIVGSEWVG
jgi:4-hydroxybenzoate polyprenyltransferase